MRNTGLLLVLAALCACQKPAAEEQSSATATTSPPAGAPAAAHGKAGCLPDLRSEVHRSSFQPVGTDAALTEQQLQKIRVKAQSVFRLAAAQACATGDIDSSDLGGFKRLLVQRGDGADSTGIYVDPERFGEETLIFQWTFAGDLDDAPVPDVSDVRDGLLCYFADEEKYGAMCAERMP